MAQVTQMEIPIRGMDCTECTQHVERAIGGLPGVQAVAVFLGTETATIHYDPSQVDLADIRQAVAAAGYQVPVMSEKNAGTLERLPDFSNLILGIFGVVFAVVVLVGVAGEGLGWFERVNPLVPWPVGFGVVLAFGFPVFKNVLRSALRRQVISHTLMSLGVVAALVVGQWLTAVVVVLFMRVGDFVEKLTTEGARKALRDLTALAPQTARVERDGSEQVVPIAAVQVEDIVVVWPGEKIPVDGEVVGGQATIDQAAITGEALPVEATVGSLVYAATIAQMGSLHIRARQIGAESTFGRVLKMVAEAEANRADIQRMGDRFSSYYLPVVAGIALLTLVVSGNLLATAAVMLVACSCSFALATPIAMLASIGAAAKKGILIKGGKSLELLDRVNTLLIDKTGTLTLGQPVLTHIICLQGITELDLLQLAASAERYSEHPLAKAVRNAASQRQIELLRPQQFGVVLGTGVHAQVAEKWVEVGNQRILEGQPVPEAGRWLVTQGATLLFVRIDGELVGILSAADQLRGEAAPALDLLRKLGVAHIELLTGDNEPSAALTAGALGIPYRANLLPEDKMSIVRAYQAQGRVIAMVGDGINDAPALAQAQVGIAMGGIGTDVAISAAHIVLMRDDWMQLPQVFAMAHRTMKVIRLNLGFTMVYNLVGLTLAATGLLPPMLAAAAQSLPDLGILGNSSRLLRQK